MSETIRRDGSEGEWRVWGVSETIIPPPSSVTADLERKPVLYLPNGKVLVRVIGFTR